MAKRRTVLERYMRQRFARYGSQARFAFFDPTNIADARIFALQAAYCAARLDDSFPMAATFLIETALSQSMTQALIPMKLTSAQKQDIRNYYVIQRALYLPALHPASQAGDDADRRALAAAARLFIQQNIGIDPQRVSWAELPCIGASPVACNVQIAIARIIVNSIRQERCRRGGACER